MADTFGNDPPSICSAHPERVAGCPRCYPERQWWEGGPRFPLRVATHDGRLLGVARTPEDIADLMRGPAEEGEREFLLGEDAE